MKTYAQRVKVLGLEADCPTPHGDIYPAHVLQAATRSPADKMKIYYQDGVKTHVWGYVSGLEFDGKHIVALANFRHEDAVGLAMRVKNSELVMAPLMTSKVNDNKECYEARIWGFQLVQMI